MAWVLAAQAKNITQPFAYDKYREDKIQEKLEQQRKTRITVERKLPKVNAVAAARILARSGGDSHAQGALPDTPAAMQANSAHKTQKTVLCPSARWRLIQESVRPHMQVEGGALARLSGAQITN